MGTVHSWGWMPRQRQRRRYVAVASYGYSNPMGYQTSDFRLLWAITPNPQPPKPPTIGLCPPPPISHLCFDPHIRVGSPPFSPAQFCTLLPLQTMTVGMN